MNKFVICIALVGYASAAIIDTSCTVAGAYADNATICSNVFSDATCTAIYIPAPAAPGVAPGSTVERALPCYGTVAAGPVVADMKNMAIATCPKTCGYCCATKEYTCSNVPYPRLNCGTITPTMCKDPLWRQTIAADCPAACGFCLLGGCIDAAPDCNTQPSICVTKGLEAFVASNCQRTCGQCSTSTTVAGATLSGGCIDANNNCAQWNRNGFCASTFYTTAQKRASCGRTCGLC